MNPPSTLPSIHLLPGGARRLRHGHPWIYSNEIRIDAQAKALTPGSLVHLIAPGGKPLGTATFNPHALIAARLFSPDPSRLIDEAYFAERLACALALRQRLIAEPFYRLIHAEADGLPGIVIDRFDTAFVCQLNTAGAEQLSVPLLAALERLFSPRLIVVRADSPARSLEGLAAEVRLARGTAAGPVELVENGTRFLADLETGQKTGWFFDQRDNRAFFAALCRERSVLDLYCHSGGFALNAVRRGARSVLAIDSSAPALALAERAAALNGFSSLCRFQREKAFDALERLGREGARFGAVACDPPSFVKSRRDLKSGLRAYRKLARLAATRVESGGDLLIASCSHNVERKDFLDAVRAGLGDAGRNGRIIRDAGASPDHPVHPALPESAYLKCLVIRLD